MFLSDSTNIGDNFASILIVMVISGTKILIVLHYLNRKNHIPQHHLKHSTK